MISFENLRNEGASPETYLIGPELLPKRGKLWIEAPEKHNKSWFLLNAAIDLASGLDLWGVPQFKVLHPFRVGYFDKELGKSRLLARLNLIAKSRLVSAEASRMLLLEPREPTCFLSTNEGLRNISRRIQQERIEIVILDPISKFYPGFDENAVQDMGIVCRNLDRIADVSGASFIVSHHESRASIARVGARRLRGSTVLGADLDTCVSLVLKSPQAHHNQYVRLEFVTRDLPVAPFFARRTAEGTIEYLGSSLPNTRPDRQPLPLETT